MSTKLLTTKEAAILIGFSAGRLRQLIVSGKAKPARSIGGTWLFTPKEIERIRTRRQKAGRLTVIV